MASGKRPRFSRLSESPPDSHGGGGGGIAAVRAAGSGSGADRGDRLHLSMASGKFFRVSRLSESPPHGHGGGGVGVTGGRAAGTGSGEGRGDRLDRSDQIARGDPYRLLPGHGFGLEKEKSADCHDGCVPREVHERLLKRLRELGDEFLAYCGDSPYVCSTPAEAAMTRKATKVVHTPRSIVSPADRSKAEQHELLYGSPLSSRWARKSGGGREPADRFQEEFYSHSGLGKGGSSSQPFRGEAVARNSPKLRQREGDWLCSCGFSNFAWRLHCRDCQGPHPEHMSGSRKGCSFPYALPPKDDRHGLGRERTGDPY